jgi:hypothetical protein
MEKLMQCSTQLMAKPVRRRASQRRSSDRRLSVYAEASSVSQGAKPGKNVMRKGGTDTWKKIMSEQRDAGMIRFNLVES